MVFHSKKKVVVVTVVFLRVVLVAKVPITTTTTTTKVCSASFWSQSHRFAKKGIIIIDDQNDIIIAHDAKFPVGDAISISPKHVFYETPLSFAFVNLKPVVPGHVLVCPKRIVEKYEEMTTEEISDAMSVSQKVAVGAFVPFLKALPPASGRRSLDWMKRLVVVVVVGIELFASCRSSFSWYV